MYKLIFCFSRLNRFCSITHSTVHSESHSSWLGSPVLTTSLSLSPPRSVNGHIPKITPPYFIYSPCKGYYSLLVYDWSPPRANTVLLFYRVLCFRSTKPNPTQTTTRVQAGRRSGEVNKKRPNSIISVPWSIDNTPTVGLGTKPLQSEMRSVPSARHLSCWCHIQLICSLDQCQCHGQAVSSSQQGKEIHRSFCLIHYTVELLLGADDRQGLHPCGQYMYNNIIQKHWLLDLNEDQFQWKCVVNSRATAAAAKSNHIANITSLQSFLVSGLLLAGQEKS